VAPKTTRFSVICPSTGRRTYKCKVKGITLNYDSSKVVYFATLKSIILENSEPAPLHNPKKIRRKHECIVVTEPESKEYKVVFKKRRLIGDFDCSLQVLNI
jgi:hypothetical protein